MRRKEFHYRESGGDDTVGGPEVRIGFLTDLVQKGNVVGRSLGVVIRCVLAACALAACSRDEPPVKAPDTLEVERQAGDFLDYYAEVLQLAQAHAAEPDSFRIALDALPGSHLDERAWEAWTRPYREDPSRLADRLERIIAERKPTP